MLASMITALKCGLPPLISLWLVYSIANVIILTRARKARGDGENPYTQNLVEEANNTIWGGMIYLVLLTIGRYCPVLVRWIFVFLAAGFTLIYVTTFMGHVEGFDRVPRETRLYGLVEAAAYFAAVIAWTWLTCRMARIFGLM